jgi:hypothetical protein
MSKIYDQWTYLQDKIDAVQRYEKFFRETIMVHGGELTPAHDSP